MANINNRMDKTKVKHQAFPTSNVNKTDCKVYKNPIPGERYKINCKTGINEKIAIPAIAVKMVPFGTDIAGLYDNGTKDKIKLPRIIPKHTYISA